MKLEYEKKLIHLKTINSTNIYAKNLAYNNAEHGVIVVADTQTEGKGRLGRKFYSPTNGIYMSIIIRDCSDFMLLTSIAAASVYTAIKHICNIDTDIKWVNDIFLSGKKVCGILCEAVTQNEKIDSAVVGIGINFVSTTMPQSVAEIATSLYNKPAPNIKKQLINDIYINLLEYCKKIDEKKFIDVCKNHSYAIGKQIIIDGKVNAKAIGLDENGGLIVEIDGEKKVLSTGEISVKVIS